MTMTPLTKVALLTMVLGLTASGTYDVMDSQLSPKTYAGQHYSEYDRTEEARRAAYDRGSISLFAERANETAAGRPPAPLSPTHFTPPKGKDMEAKLLHDRLIAAIDNGAKTDAGLALARAQASYERWVDLVADGGKEAQATKERDLFTFFIGGVDQHLK
jgi:hypothetical protein